VKPELTIEGARELRRQLKAFQGGIDGMKQIHKETGELVGREAAKLVPVRSGLLQATIRASGQAAGAVVRAGFARVPYAGPIHFGWPARGISPSPFLYDALDARRGEVIQMYEDRVADLIKKHDLA
jgi:hypothetical protein